MGDKTARERLKQKVLERWENEGGKTETPTLVPRNNPTKGSEANPSSRSSKSPVGTSVRRKSKRTSR
jgi:hypothetical protein